MKEKNVLFDRRNAIWPSRKSAWTVWIFFSNGRKQIKLSAGWLFVKHKNLLNFPIGYPCSSHHSITTKNRLSGAPSEVASARGVIFRTCLPVGKIIAHFIWIVS